MFVEEGKVAVGRGRNRGKGGRSRITPIEH